MAQMKWHGNAQRQSQRAIALKRRIVRHAKQRSRCGCRLHGAIGKLDSAQRRLDHSLHGQQRGRRFGADADKAELVFKDVRVANRIGVRAEDPGPFGDLPRRAAADHGIRSRCGDDGLLLLLFHWLLRENRAG